MITRIEVDADRGEAVPRVTHGNGALHVRRLRDTGHGVRLGLVAAQAMLLAGDRLRVEVHVSGPTRVEVVETAGTVAYDMRGGRATWDVDIDLRDGACLDWYGQPFVVAAGADVARRTLLVAEAGCRASLRETLVLGRSGEDGGTVRTRTRVTHAGLPLLAEDLDLAPDARAGWATLHGHRCLDTVTTVGHRLADGPDVLQLEGEGSVHRWIGDQLHRSTVDQLTVRSSSTRQPSSVLTMA